MTEPGTIDTLAKAKEVGRGLTLYDGKVMPQNFGQVIEFSQMMSRGGVAIPKHLRGNEGACMSIIQRSMNWEMDPWAVAAKTYLATEDGVMSYEAQLIAAVVQKWAPVKEKVWAPKYEGEGENRKCIIVLHHAETGEEYRYESPIIGKKLTRGEDGTKIKSPPNDYVGIWPKNSPLWNNEPDQALWYYSIRAMSRRFWPGIILGVYDREEVLQMAMKDITPTKVQNFLNEDEAEVREGEILEPRKAKPAESVLAPEANGKAGEVAAGPSPSPAEPHDPETGEILEEEVITPEMMAENMVKAINGFTSKVHLEDWQNESNADINALPKPLYKVVKKALDDKHLDLLPL